MAITPDRAFDHFAANHWRPRMNGTYADCCGLRLAGYVLPKEAGPKLVALHTNPPSTANRFARGD